MRARSVQKRLVDAGEGAVTQAETEQKRWKGEMLGFGSEEQKEMVEVSQ